MRLLIDTHVLLWCLADDRRLKKPTRALLTSADHVVFLSAATLWEIQIKASIGKLDLPRGFSAAVDALKFESLAVTAAHTEQLGRLPMHHRDPFDRMLIAQAQAEGLTLLSHDATFGAYDVDLLLA